MKTTHCIGLGILGVVVSLMAACASDVSPSDIKAAISAEATSAGIPCSEVMNAESSAAVPNPSAMAAACSLNGAMAREGEGADPGLVAWCDNGMCCIGLDSGLICCCDDSPSCYCG